MRVGDGGGREGLFKLWREKRKPDNAEGDGGLDNVEYIYPNITVNVDIYGR